MIGKVGIIQSFNTSFMGKRINFSNGKGLNSESPEDNFTPSYKGPMFTLSMPLKYDSIYNFHKNIERLDNRDEISYRYYTTPQDIGSGREIHATPADVFGTFEDRARDEILKEIDRLLSPESKLSDSKKEELENMYSRYLEKYYAKKETDE